MLLLLFRKQVQKKKNTLERERESFLFWFVVDESVVFTIQFLFFFKCCIYVWCRVAFVYVVPSSWWSQLCIGDDDDVIHISFYLDFLLYASLQ